MGTTNFIYIMLRTPFSTQFCGLTKIWIVLYVNTATLPCHSTTKTAHDSFVAFSQCRCRAFSFPLFYPSCCHVFLHLVIHRALHVVHRTYICLNKCWKQKTHIYWRNVFTKYTYATKQMVMDAPSRHRYLG